MSRGQGQRCGVCSEDWMSGGNTLPCCHFRLICLEKEEVIEVLKESVLKTRKKTKKQFLTFLQQYRSKLLVMQHMSVIKVFGLKIYIEDIQIFFSFAIIIWLLCDLSVNNLFTFGPRYWDCFDLYIHRDKLPRLPQHATVLWNRHVELITWPLMQH